MVTVVSVNEDDAIAAAATGNYDTQVTIDTSSGATVQPGAMMLLVVRTDKHLELRISSSFDNGSSFSNRGGVEKIPTNGEFRMVMQLVGTNHRIALKNTDSAEATVSVFTTVF